MTWTKKWASALWAGAVALLAVGNVLASGPAQYGRELLLNVYPGNQPPTPIDVHNRLPVMVTLPQSTTELRGVVHDLEADKHSFRWSVVRQPSGAAVHLESPNDSKCKVTNITVPGDHVFKFEASDGVNTVWKELTLPVYPVNSSPVIERASALPPVLKAPNSTTLLSATTSDPARDVISHGWRVKSAPVGATPRFTKQGGRDTEVSELAVEGTDVFQLMVVGRNVWQRRASVTPERVAWRLIIPNGSWRSIRFSVSCRLRCTDRKRGVALGAPQPSSRQIHDIKPHLFDLLHGEFVGPAVARRLTC